MAAGILFFLLFGRNFLAVNFWEGDNFNQSPWEIFFVFWQAILVLFGTINCAMKLDDERTYALFGFATLFAGYVLHAPGRP